jgi:hypothetical protein
VNPIHVTPDGRGEASLERIVASAPPGSALVLEGGVFALTGPLVLNTSLRLSGRPGQTIIRGNGSLPLMEFRGAGQDFSFDGLDFEKGYGSSRGAPLVSLEQNTVRWEGCRFRECRGRSQGGVAMIAKGAFTFTRCVFERNGAPEGGALYVTSGAYVIVERSVFLGNEADAGGAVFLSDRGALAVKSCTFLQNKATHKEAPGGHAIFVFGTLTYGPSGFIVNSIFSGEGDIRSDPSKTYKVFVRNSLIPPDLFGQPGFDNVQGNVTGPPKFIPVSNVVALAEGSAGTKVADLKYIPEGATDVLGRPMVHGGVADLGAVARP